MKNNGVIDGPGYYWFIAERSSKASICEYCNGAWYLINEIGAFTIERLNERGWYLESKAQ